MTDEEKRQADEKVSKVTDVTEPESAELSDEEMEEVAGGIRIAVYKKPYPGSGDQQ